MEIQTTVRYAKSTDVKKVTSLDANSYPHPWPLEWFADLIADKNHIILVAANGPSITGYVVGQKSPDSVWVVRLGVRHNAKRQGIGTRLVEAIHEYADFLPTHSLVRESNLAAQQFFRSVDYKCTKVHHQAAKHPLEAVYTFSRAKAKVALRPSSVSPSLCGTVQLT